MNLAIFDLDRTLINCDSDNEWPKYLLKKGLIEQSFVDIERNKFYQDYMNGCLNIAYYHYGENVGSGTS